MVFKFFISRWASFWKSSRAYVCFQGDRGFLIQCKKGRVVHCSSFAAENSVSNSWRLAKKVLPSRLSGIFIQGVQEIYDQRVWGLNSPVRSKQPFRLMGRVFFQGFLGLAWGKSFSDLASWVVSLSVPAAFRSVLRRLIADGFCGPCFSLTAVSIPFYRKLLAQNSCSRHRPAFLCHVFQDTILMVLFFGKSILYVRHYQAFQEDASDVQSAFREAERTQLYALRQNHLDENCPLYVVSEREDFLDAACQHSLKSKENALTSTERDIVFLKKEPVSMQDFLSAIILSKPKGGFRKRLKICFARKGREAFFSKALFFQRKIRRFFQQGVVVQLIVASCLCWGVFFPKSAFKESVTQVGKEKSLAPQPSIVRGQKAFQGSSPALSFLLPVVGTLLHANQLRLLRATWKQNIALDGPSQKVLLLEIAHPKFQNQDDLDWALGVFCAQMKQKLSLKRASVISTQAFVGASRKHSDALTQGDTADEFQKKNCTQQSLIEVVWPS